MDNILAQGLVTETNRMYTALTLYETDRSLGRDSSGQLAQCATTGCSLLNNDVYIRAMVFDAQTLAQSAYEERSAVREIMNIDHFEFFLEAERRLLMEAGVDPSLAAAIIQRCQDGREGASRSEFNTIQFSSALEELRDAVCGILAELRGSIFQQSSPNRLRRRLRASFEGVCGGVIVGLDATALAVSIGLSTAGSAVSGALGAAIVADAIAALRATGSAGQAGVSI